jgi:gas vesicle protein
MKIGRYLIGLISGLTFGMLFAPKQGKKLRKELSESGSIANGEALKILANSFHDAGKDVAGELKKIKESEQVNAALNISKERMQEYLKNIEDTGYEVAAAAQEKLEQISEMASDKFMDFKESVGDVKKKAKSKAKKGVSRAASKAKSKTKKAADETKKKADKTIDQAAKAAKKAVSSPKKFAKKAIKATSKKK